MRISDFVRDKEKAEEIESEPQAEVQTIADTTESGIDTISAVNEVALSGKYEELAAAENDIAILRDTLSARESDVAILNEALLAKDNDIAMLRDALSTRENDVTILNEALLAKDNDIAKLNDEFATRENDKAALQDELSAKSTELDALFAAHLQLASTMEESDALLKKSEDVLRELLNLGEPLGKAEITYQELIEARRSVEELRQRSISMHTGDV